MRNNRTRTARISLVCIILSAVLLVAPLSVGATGPVLSTTIRSVTGASMGIATFTQDVHGGVRIHVEVSGYNPVSGDRRLAIRNGAGGEVLVLPNLQMYPDGSASYETVTSGVSMHWLSTNPGAAIVIQADVHATSPVIGWGRVDGGGWPGWHWGPSPTPWQPPVWPAPAPQPQPWPKPKPAPAPIVGRLVVTASYGLNLRSGPSLGYPVRRILRYGATVESTGIYQWGSGYKWVKVRYGGYYYWAARAYLRPY